MKGKEYLEIIKNEEYESETTEFKENFGKETIKAVTALANARGGYIFIGIDDKGGIVGIKVGKETLNKWHNEIMQGIEPKITLGMEKVTVEDKDIVVINVPEAPIKPVSYKGRYYLRKNSSNRLMNSSEVAELHLFSTGSSWDSAETHFEVSDISREKVERYMEISEKSGRRHFKEDWLTVLRKTGLIKERATWASVLLFGGNEQVFLSQASLHCGRFKGSRTNILDDVVIEGDLIKQVEKAMDFIKKHISVRYEFTGEARRKEVWEYPLDALREAVINAIVHRDYTIPSTVYVEVYDDRIEIVSPGRLPVGMIPEALYSEEHRSVIRNKLIAQVFYDMGYIERYGSGTTRIIELCEQYGLPEPEFKESNMWFSVVFRKDIYNEEYLRSLGLNERQIKAVMYVKERGKISNTEYQEINEVSKPTATRDLSELCNLNIMDMVGSTGKGTYYILKGSQRAQRAHIRLTKGSKQDKTDRGPENEQ